MDLPVDRTSDRLLGCVRDRVDLSGATSTLETDWTVAYGAGAAPWTSTQVLCVV